MKTLTQPIEKGLLLNDSDDYDAEIDDMMCKQSLVATLLCADDQFIGPGIYRSSPERLIAVSRGGEILMPTVTDSSTMYQFNENEIVHYNLNYHYNHKYNDNSSLISDILTSLNKIGKCVTMNQWLGHIIQINLSYILIVHLK